MLVRQTGQPPSRAFHWIDDQDPTKVVVLGKITLRLYWLHGRPSRR
jgi:hypothetical protein